MNPIEHLWKDLKLSLANKKTTNKQELWNAVQEAWKAISLKRCRRLIDSMPKRSQSLIKKKGQATKH